MRTLLITYGLAGVLITSLAQQKSSATKEETVEWISQKIRQYSYQDIDGSVKHNYNIDQKEDHLVVKNTSTIVSNLGIQKLTAITGIPIKSIESVYFIEKPNNYWLTINMKGGQNLIVTKYEGLPSEISSSTELILSKDIDKENLKERLLRAFNHLIELQTGKSKKETF